jgi:hypothetical protein
MDSTYLGRQRHGPNRDPRRAGRANQGAGRDDRQQHHHRNQQYQHQSQHHHQVSHTSQRYVLPCCVVLPCCNTTNTTRRVYLVIFPLHLISSIFSSCPSTPHIVYASARTNHFPQRLTKKIIWYRAAQL